MISPRSIFFLIVVAILIASCVGLFQSVPVVWDATWDRVTGKIPLAQAESFDEPNLYPTIVEAKSEIRPGDNIVITIRGAKYQNIDKPLTISYKIQAQDTAFVKSITPLQPSVVVNVQAGYILPPIEITVETNQIDDPPLQIEFIVTQEVNDGENINISDPISLPIHIDNSPFPTGDVIKALISLAGFLLGIFGAKLVRG